MKPPESLGRRIVVAYLLYAVGFVVLFGVIAVFAVEGIETHLVDDRLAEIAAWAAPRHAGKLPVEMPAGVSFHHGAAIPLSLRGMPPGVHDKQVDGVGLRVLSGRDALGDFVVVDHASDFEKVELVVYSLFGLGFAGFLVFSLFVGVFVARRFVTPITALAAAVRERRPELPLMDDKDELGVLARAFADRTNELKLALERERFFTGDMSHELRSPLTVIMGAAEVLMAQAGEESAAYAPAERIYRAAREAAECVTVLLMLARSSEPRAAAPVSLGAIAAGETQRHQHLIGAKPVRLEYQNGTDFAVRAPRELCAAAIGNLVRNACRYTEHGAVTVRLEGRSVIVEDTGPGLPEAVRVALSGDAARAPSAGSDGTGLGLALAKRICAYLGATLALRDRPGGGSTFEIHFPPDLTKS